MNPLPAAPSPFLKLALAFLLGVMFFPPRYHCERHTDSKSSILAIEAGLVHYQTDHTDNCPPSLRALVDEKYLTRLPRDSWGVPLDIRCPGRHNRDGADIVSAGPDHLFGTADDIRSWEL